MKWVAEVVYHPGRHFLQLPGPTNTPLPVLAAIAMPTIDHRGPEFGALGREILSGIRTIFRTDQPVIIYPASGTGAWEAALVNTLSPGDRVLMYETGWFSGLWGRLAQRLGLFPEILAGDWRSGVDADAIEAQLANDRGHSIQAVCVVHNETSTGVTSDIGAVRRAIDRADHPALLIVDAISSLGTVDYHHDEWGVDVTVAGSQKGLLLPPGLSFNAISGKARARSSTARLPRAYWDWEDMIAANSKGYFPYTPATNLLQGLKVAIGLLHAEGLDTVFRRHELAAAATRCAVRHWGFQIQCGAQAEHSNGLTGVRMPEGYSADALRGEILEQCNMSLGSGLGQLADRLFRIGHMGDFNTPSILGMLAGIELGLASGAVPHRPGGIEAAARCLGQSLPREG